MNENSGRGVRIADMLRQMVAQRASDIHLQAGAAPHMRIDGSLVAFEGVPSLIPAQTEQIALAMKTESQRQLFMHRHELDFAFTIPNVARFRCNVFKQRSSVGIVMRVVQDTVPSFETLGLPSHVLEDLAAQPRGLVLVTGPPAQASRRPWLPWSTTLTASIRAT